MKNYIIIFAAFLSLTGFKPDNTRTINGTVYNSSSKMGLAFTTVSVLGTGISITTNLAGHYGITLPDGKTRLVFAATGFKNDTLTIGKSNTLDVYLHQLPSLRADTS